MILIKFALTGHLNLNRRNRNVSLSLQGLLQLTCLSSPHARSPFALFNVDDILSQTDFVQPINSLAFAVTSVSER